MSVPRPDAREHDDTASQAPSPVWPRDLVSALLRLRAHLSARRRVQGASLLLLTVAAACAEVAAIGTALPFMVALTTPDQLLVHPVIGPWLQAAGTTLPSQVRMAASGAFACAALLAGLLRVALSRGTTAWVFAAGADLDAAMFRRTMHQPYPVHVARHSSEVIAGVTHHSNVLVYQVLATCLVIANSVLMMTIVLGALVTWRPLTVLSAFGALVGVYGVIAIASKRRFVANGEIVSGASARVIRLLQEGLGGIRDVLINGTQDHYARRFAAESRRLRAAQGTMQFLSASPRYGIEAIGLGLIAGLAWLLSREGDGLDSALTTIGALAFTAQRVMPMLQDAYWSYSAVVSAQPSLTEALALLDQPEPDPAATARVEPLPFREAIRLENVGFRYAESTPWVLRDVSLDIPRGARLGVIGVSGGGKSTLLDLIVGLQSPVAGRLSIDGVPLDDANRAGWRQRVAQVPQSIHLADSSIEENIAYGVPASAIDPARVRDAARRARIADTIESMADGYRSRVGEHGVRLSGGQRQRIGLARALYKRADVLVLDEATSALDTATEREVIDTIEALGREITVIMVAHRLTTLERCDRIVRIDGGRVEPVGCPPVEGDGHADRVATDARVLAGAT